MKDRWFKNHRMEWIAESLRVFGHINRQHIQRKFGLSAPQASIDLRDFQKLNPKSVVYDLSNRRYVATWALKVKP